MQVIILAGGKGTRLKSETGDIPKIMVDINGIPFFNYVLDKLNNFNISKVILAVGYNKEYIKNYYKDNYKGLKIVYSEENQPLGTGGAVKKALKLCDEESCFIINGDIYQNINYDDMYNSYINSDSDVFLALKPMKNITRFGTVKVNNNEIIEFNEKKEMKEGLINIGCYIFKKNILENFPNIFSLENDFFHKNISKIKNSYYIYDDYFTDIGIPDDYYKFLDTIKSKKN